MKRSRDSIRNNRLPKSIKNLPDEDIRVDLHGMTCDEATNEVEGIINSASSGDRILIIHGKGTGILRDHIRKYLNIHSKVAKILLGEKEKFPGKAGVCLAIIK